MVEPRAGRLFGKIFCDQHINSLYSGSENFQSVKKRPKHKTIYYGMKKRGSYEGVSYIRQLTHRTSKCEI